VVAVSLKCQKTDYIKIQYTDLQVVINLKNDSRT